jgi:hypothetical protein
MRRYLILAILLSTVTTAGLLWFRGQPGAQAERTGHAMPPPVAAAVQAPAAAPAAATPEPELVAPVSSVTDAEREARRFKRYDKDRDAGISRDEYLINRKKAFARADADGDGKLGFEEYAAATIRKFGKADLDADGRLAAKEFATTAVKRRAKPVCDCERDE